MISVLRVARIIKGMTLYDLAKKVGINSARLSYIERNIEHPTKTEYQRLAAILNLDVRRNQGELDGSESSRTSQAK